MRPILEVLDPCKSDGAVLTEESRKFHFDSYSFVQCFLVAEIFVGKEKYENVAEIQKHSHANCFHKLTVKDAKIL